MSISTVAKAAAVVLAGALLLATGYNYAQNRALQNQVRELSTLVQQLSDVRAADENALEARAGELREIDENARKKQAQLDAAAARDASDSEFIDSLRRVFAPAVSDK